MKKRILSWGLILSLVITLLPVSAMATEESLSQDGQTEAAQCTCGAQPDEAGAVTHAETCPLFSPPQVPGEEPAVEPDDPATKPDDSATELDGSATEPEDPATEPEDPVKGTEKPVEGTEEPAQGTEKPAVGTLTPPDLTCEPLDEFNSSDMVLTVAGAWDSYAWEACAYGNWFAWTGDGPSLTLSKEDFTVYGFRCTVTLGEQSVTSETFAYDPAVLERPMLLANGLSGGSLSGESAYIRYYKSARYHTRFDIHGVDNGTEFKTTYGDGGYRTAISVDGGAKVEVPYQSGAASVGSSLTAQTTLDIVNGDRYVKITYTVTNSGSTTQNFQIGSSADVMIGNNDYAQVTGTSTGLSMDGSPKNNYKFQLVAPDCKTLWFGFYSQAYNNIFHDLPDKTQGYDGDSGMAWSWEGTVAPGQTWSRYVLIGAGELPDAPDAPVLSANSPTSWKAGEAVTITGTAAGSPAADTVYVNFGGKEYEAAVQNGTFSVTFTVPEDTPEGSNSFTYWGTTDEGGISEIKTQEVTVMAAPFVTLTTGSVTVMEGDTVDLNSYIRAQNGDVTISPTSIDTSTPGTKTVTYTASKAGFENKTATLIVTVLSKPAALSVTTAALNGDNYTFTATMDSTGGLTFTETGFVYGALQNPTLTLNDGQVETTDIVNTKGGILSAAISKADLVYGVSYYARAYAQTADGTVIYGAQSAPFGVGNPNYGTFSVTGNGNVFTITRDGTDGEQTVYYRTVNGSAIGGTHFVHQAGSVTFAAGETSETVTVTENSVTNPYNSNAATAYSNADRTYSFEIYRVVGGATINQDRDSATRTMTMDSDYTVGRTVYNEKERLVSTSNDNNYVADRSGSNSTDQDVYFTNSRENNQSYPYVVGDKTYYYNFNVQRSVDVGTDLENAYLKATATGFLYKATFDYYEDDDCYQHVWVANHAPNNLNGSYNISGPLPLTTGVFGTAIYTARWETKEKNGESGGLSLPSETCTGKAHTVNSNKENSKIVNNAYFLFDINDTAHLWFSATGQDTDRWHVTKYTDWLKVQDTQEPQLLGIAPMAGGSYLPGDSVTVALVFDEIVDSKNSSDAGLRNTSTITTNWGTFTYAGGTDTNVLYFTGTVADDASGNLTVTSINCANSIKDMADDTGTATGSSVNETTDATLGTGDNAPTVTVSDITNTNGTLTGTVSTTNTTDVKLEYVWSDSATAPATGWTLVVSGTAVHTKQTSGTWYLHARATNSSGAVSYASKSFTFQSDTPTEPPTLNVTVNNNDWARERNIMVTPSPANTPVTVKTPGGTSDTVSGDTYTATANGTYVFTLTSGGETVTQTVTVSKIDRDAPTVEIVNLNDLNHTEAVTLTVNVSDGASGIQSVTGTWNNGSGGQSSATLTGGTNGVYTATSPDQSGEWTLTVTATDKAGNQTSKTSSTYTVDLSVPTVTVERQSAAGSGVTYNYTITAGGSDIIAVQMPEGFELGDNVTLPTANNSISGTLTFTQSGTYYITVTDAAGHVVTSAAMTVAETEAVDATPPEVRLSANSNGAASLTIHVSVFEEGGTPSVTVSDGSNITVSSPLNDGDYTGTFSVTAAGTYTVTATDGSNNEGTASITVYSVTFDGDGISTFTQLVASGDKATEPPVPTRAGYNFGGWYSDGKAYDFGAAVEKDLTLTARWSAIPATAPTVTVGNNVTQAYGTENGTISIPATAAEDTAYTLTYQWYSNTSNSTSGGTVISGATERSYSIPAETPVGTHHYYCVVTATRNDNGETASATSGVIKVEITKAGQEPPATGEGYTINYKKETITIDPGYEVFDATDNGTEIEDGGSITPGTTVYIRKQGSDTHKPSDWRKIQIPPRPTAPDGITKTDETIKGKADGTVSGITTEMEYRIDDENWTAGPANLSNLSAGTTVTVRYPASDTQFASEETKVTILGSDVTLTAIFGEDGGTDVADKTGLSYGEKITAPTISRTGYTLEGWYNGETKWNFETDTVKDNLTLTAQWNLVTYTITYDLDGGTLAEGEENPTTYTVETDTFSLNNPTKPGYTFAGWTGSNGTTPQPTVTISKGTTGNKSYTAHWALNAPTVTLNAIKPDVTYGESITLTTVPGHGAAGVAYTYEWSKDGQKLDGETGSTLTLTDVAHSGTYTVTVTASASGQSQTISSNDVTVTIRKKPIFATWAGLNRVYGEAGTVTVLLPDILTGDAVTAKISGAGSDAKSYQLTAVLDGDDAPNYALQNPTATLTIQPKPVIFTVASNAVQADGKGKSATVTPDDAACTYTVSYRQDGGEVASPTDAGSYEIWVKITNANYRHTNGDDTMQVGTLTITLAPPVVYTASFGGGEGATGEEPARQTAVAGGQITLPTNPFNKTVGTTRYRFTGWRAEGDSKLYQPGECFTMPTRDVTFTAQWEAVFAVSGGVTEKNPDDDNAPGRPVESAVVGLWLGANKIGETATDPNGTYTFDNLIPGIYNLVVTKDERTVTSMVIITDSNRVQDASLPAYVTNSVVEVAPGSPDIVVGQLDQAFTEEDQETAQDGGKVELTFTAEEKQPDEVTEDLAKIDEKAPSGVNLALTMDYAITKTVTTVSGDTETTTIPQSHTLLEILLPLPTQLQGKYSYSVYRVHSSTGNADDKVAQELKEGEANRNKLGEYFEVNADKTVLTLHVKCFSTYVVGYSDPPVKPILPDHNDSGSGSNSFTPTYPPKVEQPENGSISTSPNAPQKGDKVTLTPIPDAGYTVNEVTVTGPDGKPVEVVPNDDGTYTFVQPAGKVTISVTFRQILNTSDCPRNESCPIASFSDADPSAWYHDGVHYCVEQGLMQGTGKTTFGPNISITRGQIVTILWRLEGSPASGSAGFSDVSDTAYCAQAVGWAATSGVTNGYTDGTFRPNMPITRAQMAAMLWRYAGSPDADGGLAGFTDAEQTGTWAQPAMIWAVDQGVISGMSHNRLVPRDLATRAQAATILMRFSINVT